MRYWLIFDYLPLSASRVVFFRCSLAGKGVKEITRIASVLFPSLERLGVHARPAPAQARDLARAGESGLTS